MSEQDNVPHAQTINKFFQIRRMSRHAVIKLWGATAVPRPQQIHQDPPVLCKHSLCRDLRIVKRSRAAQTVNE